jgi:nucleoside-diphosphate-sugar epimerase
MLGYEPQISLKEGLEKTFDWYCEYFTGQTPDEWEENN